MRVRWLAGILATLAGCSSAAHPPRSFEPNASNGDVQPTPPPPTRDAGSAAASSTDSNAQPPASQPAAPAVPVITALPAGGPVAPLAGVLLDPATPTAFLMRDTNQLEAVDIKTGKTRWIVNHAEKPFWLSGTHLLAQAGTTVVVLDTRKGKLDKTCTTTGATWSPPPLTARLGHYSAATATGNGPDRAIIEWSADTFYAGGARPTPEIERRARTHAEGIVDVDLAGCTLSVRSQSSTVPVPVPQTSPVTQSTSGGITTYTQIAGTRAIDGTEASVVMQTTAGTAHALLRRRASGNALPDIQMATGNAGYLHAQISADGRHVALVVQDPASGNGGAFQYDTTLYELATGTRVATFRVPWHVGGVLVVGDTLVDMTSNGVRGFDLNTSKERWKRALRSTVYNGPMPP